VYVDVDALVEIYLPVHAAPGTKPDAGDPLHSRPDPGHFQYIHPVQPAELSAQGDA